MRWSVTVELGVERESSRRPNQPRCGRANAPRRHGQESNYTTWRLANMNLAIRGIGAGDSFHADSLPDPKADHVLANPPFDNSDWRGDLLHDDKPWARCAA